MMLRPSAIGPPAQVGWAVAAAAAAGWQGPCMPRCSCMPCICLSLKHAAPKSASSCSDGPVHWRCAWPRAALVRFRSSRAACCALMLRAVLLGRLPLMPEVCIAGPQGGVPCYHQLAAVSGLVPLRLAQAAALTKPPRAPTTINFTQWQVLRPGGASKRVWHGGRLYRPQAGAVPRWLPCRGPQPNGAGEGWRGRRTGEPFMWQPCAGGMRANWRTGTMGADHAAQVKTVPLFTIIKRAAHTF